MCACDQVLFSNWRRRGEFVLLLDLRRCVRFESLMQRSGDGKVGTTVSFHGIPDALSGARCDRSGFQLSGWVVGFFYQSPAD